MTAAQIVGAAVGGLIIILVLWKVFRSGVPKPEDRDMEGGFWSGGD